MSDPGQTLDVNGVSLYVEDHGEGIPVLLIHANGGRSIG
jgi:hypothetical protein